MLKSIPAGAHPDAKYTTQRLGPMRVVRTTLKPGEWVDTTLPACSGYHAIDNISVQTRGITIDEAGILQPRHDGWNSRTDIDAIAETRVVRRIAINDVEQWCVRPLDPEASMSAASVVVFQPGGYGALPQGNELLVVDGTVQVDDIDYYVGSHLVAKNRGIPLVFETAGIAIFWPTVL